jgi:hypothetical protein
MNDLTLRTPTIVGPRDVPKLRAWCSEQWRRDGLFWRAAQLARTRRNNMFPMVVADAVAGFDAPTRADIYARWELNTLADAQLWWVSTEMQQLLEAAALSVPGDITVADIEQPDPAGLAVFTHPLVGSSADTGNPINVRAILWGPTLLPPFTVEQLDRDEWNSGISISSYTMMDLDRGLSAVELADSSQAIMDAATGQPMRAGDKLRAHGQLWSTCGRSDWIDGTAVGDTTIIGAEYPAASASAIEDRKVLVAFWTLVHQAGIAETHTERPARPEVRRLQRAGWTREHAEVRVVKLRNVDRAEPGEPTGEKRHYSHRFIVGGHWRNQACGPHRSLRRLVWIHPYIKGPDDAELATPTTVKAWVR